MKDKTTAFFIGSLVAFIALGSALSLFHVSAIATDPSLWNIYASESMSFSVQYPEDYTIDEQYSYEIAPQRRAEGIALKVPPIFTQGTNLSSDSYISIETIPEFSSCNIAQYLYNMPTQDVTLIDGGWEYSVGEEVGENAGSYYEEKVFLRNDIGPCLVVRYFIHTMSLEDYATGNVREFDRAALLGEFDQIRRSLTRQNAF
ncbi:hypothetical protein H7X87_01520 [Acetobacteraceae bacterium]|nr:hypothetical protein [Candidatus Parcubacteria bacterium]